MSEKQLMEILRIIREQLNKTLDISEYVVDDICEDIWEEIIDRVIL